jgi:hypothetical protein
VALQYFVYLYKDSVRLEDPIGSSRRIAKLVYSNFTSSESDELELELLGESTEDSACCFCLLSFSLPSSKTRRAAAPPGNWVGRLATALVAVIAGPDGAGGGGPVFCFLRWLRTATAAILMLAATMTDYSRTSAIDKFPSSTICCFLAKYIRSNS